MDFKVCHHGNFFEIFSRVHATLQPALSVRPSVGWLVGRSRFTLWAEAPKGPMTYAFTYAEIFPPPSSLLRPPPISEAPI